MKKIILLCTAICASTLNSMDREQLPYQMLPQELKREIITTALVISNNHDEAINTIKTASTLHGISSENIFDNLKDFTALIDILAEKFSDIPRRTMAEKFNTLIATNYITLGDLFVSRILGSTNVMRVQSDTLKNASDLLEEGVDPNFSWFDGNWFNEKAKNSLLSEVCRNIILFNLFCKGVDEKILTIVTLLLHHGAKPDTDLIEKTEKEIEGNPIALNLALLNLLKQGNQQSI